jgi:ketosteroid isomerase-like protein
MARPRRTKSEVPAFFQAIGETLEVTEFKPLSFTSNDTDVMGVIRFAVVVKTTGKSGAMDLHHWWRLRDGKVVLYRGTEDTALVRSC